MKTKSIRLGGVVNCVMISNIKDSANIADLLSQAKFQYYE